MSMVSVVGESVMTNGQHLFSRVSSLPTELSPEVVKTIAEAGGRINEACFRSFWILELVIHHLRNLPNYQIVTELLTAIFYLQDAFIQGEASKNIVGTIEPTSAIDFAQGSLFNIPAFDITDLYLQFDQGELFTMDDHNEVAWRSCPQCKRENSIDSWDKNSGKCPNCNDLHDKG